MSTAAIALGWAVLHFMWQGTIIGLLTLLILELVPRRSNAGRYTVSCVALGLSLATFSATLCSLHSSLADTAATVVLPDGIDLAHPDYAAAAPILAQLTGATAEPPDAAMTVVAWLWTLGVLIMAMRLVRAGAWAHRLRSSGVTPIDQCWQAMLDGLRNDLGLARVVRLMRSELVDGPIVIGWLQPLILVPASMLTALTPEQVRCVLAHELAHVQRYDHLVNALQALVEVTLFFHPVIWWLSRVARDEREHCCDRVAIDATGRPLALARALTRLESHRLVRPSVALAANDQRGPLMQRIQRILDVPAPRSHHRLGVRTIAILGSAALVAGLGLPQASATTNSAAPSARMSMEGRDAESDYAIVEGRVLEAVEAGNLSASDAKRTLVALRKTMLGKKVRRETAPAMWDSVTIYVTPDGKDDEARRSAPPTLPEGVDLLEDFFDFKERPESAKAVEPKQLLNSKQAVDKLRLRAKQLEDAIRFTEINAQVEELNRALRQGQAQPDRLKSTIQSLRTTEEQLRAAKELHRQLNPDANGRVKLKRLPAPTLEISLENDKAIHELEQEAADVKDKLEEYKARLKNFKEAAKAARDAAKGTDHASEHPKPAGGNFVLDTRKSNDK